MALEMYNYTPHAVHHAKFDFDRSTWVVWVNIQFVTVLVSFFFFSFLVYFGSRTSRTGRSIVTNLRLLDVLCGNDVLLGVRVFYFYTFAYFQQSIKLMMTS